MPNETNFSGFFDGPRLPSLVSYCASPECGTGYPCDACRLEDGIACDACGSAATVLVVDGTPSKLPLCAACKAKDEADEAAGKGGV